MGILVKKISRASKNKKETFACCKKSNKNTTLSELRFAKLFGK